MFGSLPVSEWARYDALSKLVNDIASSKYGVEYKKFGDIALAARFEVITAHPDQYEKEVQKWIQVYEKPANDIYEIATRVSQPSGGGGGDVKQSEMPEGLRQLAAMFKSVPSWVPWVVGGGILIVLVMKVVMPPRRTPMPW
jgi:hypothetical protein